MWLLLLEAFLALCLLVFIVWWIIPSRRRRKEMGSKEMGSESIFPEN